MVTTNDIMGTESQNNLMNQKNIKRNSNEMKGQEICCIYRSICRISFPNLNGILYFGGKYCLISDIYRRIKKINDIKNNVYNCDLI